jgi:hypothetical protein
MKFSDYKASDLRLMNSEVAQAHMEGWLCRAWTRGMLAGALTCLSAVVFFTIVVPVT